ncbi:aminodeoxychorismate synthase component I [Thalassospira indica]|uniref:aminodeoxychorismate synthase n=1 Tax=Thalassospira indica TaxID=1891279 RepID=A0ABN5NER0_9PROT|nr:aminodeoxychorismate synthase component I [Thalassospira indica]AXO14868.1 aminodeoxychorismate synthase component I [Thalassospira indica]OAZ13382.1 aminobenzoate synthetase [Thalassospira profundimaris]
MLIEECPYIEPVDAYGAFAPFADSHFLDSGDRDRFSYIVVSPLHKLTAKNGQAVLDGFEIPGNPFDVLGDLLARYQIEAKLGLPPFQGGAVGYFGYELAHQTELLPTAPDDWLSMPDMAVGIYDLVIAFDQIDRRMWLISTGIPETEGSKRGQRANDRMALIRKYLRLARPLIDTPAVPHVPNSTWQSNFDRASYEAAVQRVIDYIFAGDIFQANLSQSFRAEYASDAIPKRFDLYRRLRDISSAPFGAFLNFGDAAVLSNSPERFLRVRNRQIETKPIKGTRPRGETPLSDAELAQELMLSPKDRAENVMIVDLLRNDLSKVSNPHSVRTPVICALESYANVHHLVSTVTGELREGKTAVDALRACFPGGSITGAPKIRAMEIITELEKTTRGAYCGAIGYIGFDGAMDTNIAIRTLSVNGGKMAFNVGGGIVADSDPAGEYEETLVKAAKMFELFGLSAGDLL